jgi:hypothetical protein
VVYDQPGLGAFNDGDAGPANLFTVVPLERGPEQLTAFTAVDTGATQPRATADGSGIVFTMVGPDRFTRVMAYLNTDGTGQRPLTATGLMGTHPDLRPTPGVP